MKRITLNIDVEDNELFDKEAMELIKAKIREQLRTTIFDEYVKREVDARIGEKKSDIGYSFHIKEAVQRYAYPLISDTIKEVCKNIDFYEVCMKYAQDYVKYLFTDDKEKVLSLNSIVDREIEKQITEKVQAKLKSVLGK